MTYRVRVKTQSFTAILLSGLSEELAKQTVTQITGKTVLDRILASSSLVKSQVVQDAWTEEEEPSANPSVI